VGGGGCAEDIELTRARRRDVDGVDIGVRNLAVAIDGVKIVIACVDANLIRSRELSHDRIKDAGTGVKRRSLRDDRGERWEPLDGLITREAAGTLRSSLEIVALRPPVDAFAVLHAHPGSSIFDHAQPRALGFGRDDR